MSEMTQQQEAHLARVQALFARLADRKYRRGQEEHGGDLWQMSALQLVDNAIDEAIDQVVYLATLREKIDCHCRAKVVSYSYKWGEEHPTGKTVVEAG